ncbi:MAG TPA: dienelactone hydrolase family protein [Thermohalobaculum sp.]|nr:dienelactone hydrolase family protein [Thermohalobaculum sp.]
MRYLLAALMLVTLALPASAGMREIEHDGKTRRFYVEFPAGPRNAPAIIVLHGGAGTPSKMRKITEFTLHERGWVEIYPEGIKRQWNDGRTGADGKILRKTDDLGFLRAIVNQLASEGVLDPTRVFFTGVSNGGAMTLRMICQAPELVAGAVVVIMNQPIGMDCPDGPPVPLLFIQSVDDPLVPFAGGPINAKGDRGSVLSANDTLAQYAFRNRCGAWEEIAITDHFPNDQTLVRLHAYRGCAEPLRQFIIDGGGHTWPGNKNHRWVEKLLGRTSLDISATFEIEAFFTDLARR